MIKEKFYTVDEFVKMVPVKTPTVRAWIHQGKLPVVRFGRKVFIKQSVVEKILDEGL